MGRPAQCCADGKSPAVSAQVEHRLVVGYSPQVGPAVSLVGIEAGLLPAQRRLEVHPVLHHLQASGRSCTNNSNLAPFFLCKDAEGWKTRPALGRVLISWSVQQTQLLRPGWLSGECVSNTSAGCSLPERRLLHAWWALPWRLPRCPGARPPPAGCPARAAT
jgi:hypothetical protein